MFIRHFYLWWSLRWPPGDVSHQQEAALCIPSLPLHMLFLFGWPSCQRSDMTLVEVSQRALDSLYIGKIWLLHTGVFCKTGMVFVSILVKKNCLSLSIFTGIEYHYSINCSKVWPHAGVIRLCVKIWMNLLIRKFNYWLVSDVGLHNGHPRFLRMQSLVTIGLLLTFACHSTLWLKHELINLVCPLCME